MVKRFVHSAKILFVHEGNLFDALFDLGFNITVRQPVRIRGLDLPELRSPDTKAREIAKKAKDCSMRLLLNKWCLIETFKEGRRPTIWPGHIFLSAQTRYGDTRIIVEGEEYVDVCKYLRLLYDGGFNVTDVDVPGQA